VGGTNFATEFLWLESLKFTVLCVDEYRYLYLQYPGRARNHSLSFQQEMEMSKSCLFLFVSWQGLDIAWLFRIFASRMDLGRADGSFSK